MCPLEPVFPILLPLCEEKKKLAVVMRREHRAGEKLFTDYAGQTMGIVDPYTGEVRPGPMSL
ncbi:MAG: hypothetical protein PHX89_09275 [bacterium]|nr:hypothetical protein [bacterium]MDD4559105.1 hypothetical protein [bacterium]